MNFDDNWSNGINTHDDVEAAIRTKMADKVDKSQRINGKALNGDITITATDVGAASGIKLNGVAQPKDANGVVDISIDAGGGGNGTVTAVKINNGQPHEPDQDGVVELGTVITGIKAHGASDNLPAINGVVELPEQSAGGLTKSDINVESQGDGTVDINVGDDTYTIDLNHSHPDKQDKLYDSLLVPTGKSPNIKTINGQSLLGGGNLDIAQVIYLKFDYNDKAGTLSFTDIDGSPLTHAQVVTLLRDSSRYICLYDDNYTYFPLNGPNEGYRSFGSFGVDGDNFIGLDYNDTVITVDEILHSSLTNSILNLGFIQGYPVKTVMSSAAATVTLSATGIYDLGTVSSNKTINLPSTVQPGAEYEVRFTYSSGTITWPSGVVVANDATLTLTAGKLYHVIITGGVLYFSETTPNKATK